MTTSTLPIARFAFDPARDPALDPVPAHEVDLARSASPVPEHPRVVASPRISATVLTRNSAAHLDEVLDALRWCDEVVVLDTGSSDATLDIANRYPNVTLERLAGPFPGFGPAHRQAVQRARNDWILSIDSDEVVSRALVDEIGRIALDSGCVYSIPFENYFNGRFITSCGWHPDRHERLFDRRVTNFCASLVHEKVDTRQLAVLRLQAPIQHYSYDGTDDFLRKMRAYSQLFAEQNVGRKSATPWKAVRHSLWAFLKSYVLQRGFSQGYEGLAISAYKAHTVFWKYLCLYEAGLRAR